MIYKVSINYTATTDAVTTWESDYLNGLLLKMRTIKGTYTTKKTITAGVSGESSTLKFWKNFMTTTDKNYFPRASGQTATGDSSFVLNHPWCFQNEKIKLWVQTTTSSAKRAGRIDFYLDGVPGAGGSTS